MPQVHAGRTLSTKSGQAAQSQQAFIQGMQMGHQSAQANLLRKQQQKQFELYIFFATGS